MTNATTAWFGAGSVVALADALFNDGRATGVRFSESGAPQSRGSSVGSGRRRSLTRARGAAPSRISDRRLAMSQIKHGARYFIADGTCWVWDVCRHSYMPRFGRLNIQVVRPLP